MLNNLNDLYNAEQTNQANHVVKVLTIVSAIFIPLPNELDALEQERLIEGAILNAKQFQGKAAIFITSASISAELLNRVKLEGAGRMVVVTIDPTQSSVQFVAKFFNSRVNQKIPEQVRRAVYDAVLKASRSVVGKGASTARRLDQNSLVLAPEQIFGTEGGSIGLVAQQFSLREGNGSLERIYDAHIQYAFRIAGLRTRDEMDADVLNNIQVRNLPSDAGISRIVFTEEGLKRALQFLNALFHARQLTSQSA